MKRLRSIYILALGVLAFSHGLRAQQQPAWEIEPLWGQGSVEYYVATGVVKASNGVFVKYGDTVLTADTVSVNQTTGKAIADGEVRIQRGDQIWISQHLLYNFKTHQLEAEQFRTGEQRVFAGGQGVHGEVTNRVYVATNSVITTDNVADPRMKIRARYIRIVPGERIEARDAVLYVMDVPVFYFPYYSRNLGSRANNFNFVPGYRSSFGPFLLGSYNWFLSDELDGTLHLDYRERRGVGTGPDINYHFGKWGDGTVRYYYLHDQTQSRR